MRKLNFSIEKCMVNEKGQKMDASFGSEKSQFSDEKWLVWPVVILEKYQSGVDCSPGTSNIDFSNSIHTIRMEKC